MVVIRKLFKLLFKKKQSKRNIFVIEFIQKGLLAVILKNTDHLNKMLIKEQKLTSHQVIHFSMPQEILNEWVRCEGCFELVSN